VSSVTERKTAYLALADGSVFQGFSWGAETCVTGEVVFTTGMTGYQEVLTDPSYCGQIVCMTNPHIGNTGITARALRRTVQPSQPGVARTLLAAP
jgi:carbamoyl-phosphate synthase small subunit